MHSWVFRNRRQLELIYARRRAGSARVEQTSATRRDQAEAEREGLGIYVLFPRQSPILPAA